MLKKILCVTFNIGLYPLLNGGTFSIKKTYILLNKIIENMIIKNPNQWIWTHDRWK